MEAPERLVVGGVDSLDRAGLITEVVCGSCGHPVDVNLIGLLTVPVRGYVSDLAPTPYEPTPEARASITALQAVWLANFREFGLCGHMVTVDAPAELAEHAGD